MKCHLCPAPAIVEGLCLSCADLLWMAQRWQFPARAKLLLAYIAQGVEPHTTTEFAGAPACAAKMAAMPTPAHAAAFFAKLDAAKVERKRKEAQVVADEAALERARR